MSELFLQAGPEFTDHYNIRDLLEEIVRLKAIIEELEDRNMDLRVELQARD